MKLKDIADMKEYLENRCYCPGEIYDMTGLFYQVFSAETECRLLCEGERGAVHGKFVIAKAKDEWNPQIIYIEITDNKVDDCVRIDATDHNITQVIHFLQCGIEKMSFDEFPSTETQKSLDEVFKYADAIMMN